MMPLLYKDYQDSVTYDDGLIVLQILQIEDFITTECQNAADVKKAFEVLVDDYLTTRVQTGKKTNKPFKRIIQRTRVTRFASARCNGSGG